MVLVFTDALVYAQVTKETPSATLLISYWTSPMEKQCQHW